MQSYTTIQDWGDLVSEYVQNSNSLAIGVFNKDGELLDSNAAMRYFLEVDTLHGKPRNAFVNPDFSVLTQKQNYGKVFEGVMTLGNYRQISYSLQASVYRQEDRLLLLAEPDVPQLFIDNKKMSRLNQDVNNLQRQLIKEKSNLQATLKELQETQQMLVHSEKMNAMGKLVAGVAHEINNPIAFVYSNAFSLEKYIVDLVRSYAELEGLVKANSNPEIVSKVNEIRQKNDLDFLIEDISDMTLQSKIGLGRIKTIVEDLRKFSRLDEAELKTIDLIDNISTTLAIAGLELSKKNISLKLSTPETLMIECFPGQLNQAVLNVIINAAQAIDLDGHITISVEEVDSIVQIKISDDGCGIPENLKSKIFDPFFTTKPVGSGTGLGLSIAYKIVNELHRGNIVVDSTEGLGSCFVLSIPKTQM